MVSVRQAQLRKTRVFETLGPQDQDDALVFDVSTPDAVEEARQKSNRLNQAFNWLKDFGVVPDWPGFDILTLDSRLPNSIDRMIELKSSGVASRVQEMTWNEWKTAKASKIREQFYLYLVGNLRSDLPAAKPYIRTIRNPFAQMIPDIKVSRAAVKKVQLSVNEFEEAEHLDLSVYARPTGVE